MLSISPDETNSRLSSSDRCHIIKKSRLAINKAAKIDLVNDLKF
jgi:hypothetical protein